MVLKLGAFRLKFVRGQEYGQKLVTPLPDLVANVLERDLVAIIPQRILPGLGVKIDGINQRPVHVEDHSSDHRDHSLTPGSTPAGRRGFAPERCGLPEVPRRHRDAAALRQVGDVDIPRPAVTDPAPTPGV